MPTYLSEYEDHLTERMERGGDEADVEKAVSEYNRLSTVKLVAWVKDAGLKCSYCEEPAVTDGIRPTDEVTCAEHKS